MLTPDCAKRARGRDKSMTRKNMAPAKRGKGLRPKPVNGLHDKSDEQRTLPAKTHAISSELVDFLAEVGSPRSAPRQQLRSFLAKTLRSIESAKLESESPTARLVRGEARKLLQEAERLLTPEEEKGRESLAIESIKSAKHLLHAADWLARAEVPLAPPGKKGQNEGNATQLSHVALLQEREKNRHQKDVFRRAFAGLLEDKDYADLTKSATDVEHYFFRELAARLQPALNAYLQTRPSESYADKQDIASWVNNELHKHRLAIRCPKTGKPANLIADVQGGEDSPSRFRLDVRGDDGNRVRTFSSRELFELELMEDALREEPLARKYRENR
jgi:hypothetical protein